jgi:hypothetical protein
MAEAPPVVRPPVEKPYVPPQPAYRPPRQEQKLSAVAKAAEEVRRIVGLLEEALEHMEEVQNLVELAEDQKHDDEREIENLRRALRRIQTPPREQERRESFRREPPRREEPPRQEISSEQESHEEPPVEEPSHSEPEHDDPGHEGQEEQGI